MAKSFNDLISGSSTQTRVELGHTRERDDGGQTRTTMEDSQTPRIVDKDELEMAYRIDPMVFNGINTNTQTMLNPGFDLSGPHDTFFSQFLDNLGHRGGSATKQEFMEKLLKYPQIYGEFVGEYVFNDAGDRIVDLEIVDPKTIDYARDHEGHVAVDEFNKPLGYVQKVPHDIHVHDHRDRDIQVDEVPDEVFLRQDEIFIKRERIFHIKLNTVGEGFHGIGLIEPIYSVTQQKLNLEEELTEGAMRVGFGIPVVKVGDMNHEPTKELMDTVGEKVEGMSNRTGLRLPYYNDVEYVKPDNQAEFIEYLNYLISQQIAGVGVPKSFIEGGGEEVNRATLERQELLYKMALKQMVDSITSQFEHKVFKRIADMKGWASTPEFEWGNLLRSELDAKVERISSLAHKNVGVIRPTEELENEILKLEGLPQGGTQVPRPEEESDS